MMVAGETSDFFFIFFFNNHATQDQIGYPSPSGGSHTYLRSRALFPLLCSSVSAINKRACESLYLLEGL